MAALVAVGVVDQAVEAEAGLRVEAEAPVMEAEALAAQAEVLAAVVVEVTTEAKVAIAAAGVVGALSKLALQAGRTTSARSQATPGHAGPLST